MPPRFGVSSPGCCTFRNRVSWLSTNVGPVTLKRIFWYPYGEATGDALRAVTELVSAPVIGDKLRAARRLVGSARKAFKEKL